MSPPPPTDSNTPPSLLSPVSIGVLSDNDGPPSPPGPNPFVYRPRNKNDNLNEPTNFSFFESEHNHWIDLNLRNPEDYDIKPAIVLSVIGRGFGDRPEILKLKNCKYTTPQMFKFKVHRASLDAQYIIGLRCNTFSSLTKKQQPNIYRVDHDGGYSSMEVKKGPYTGWDLRNQTIQFNDMKMEGCASSELAPNLVLLEPGRVWMPVLSVYEWKDNEAIFIVESLMPELAFGTIPDEQLGKQCDAPRAVENADPVVEEPIYIECDTDDGPIVRLMQDPIGTWFRVNVENNSESDGPLF